jgi:RNase H-like domain found in reverse transcriptase
LFIAELILKIYILSLLIVIKTNILDFVLGIYLVQKYLDGWYLVIFYNRKMTLLELNYNIYNKELLSIVAAFKE